MKKKRITNPSETSREKKKVSQIKVQHLFFCKIFPRIKTQPSFSNKNSSGKHAQVVAQCSSHHTKLSQNKIASNAFLD